MKYRELSIDLIDRDPNNARKRFTNIANLADNILEHGLLQPMVVKPKGARYELISGERRLRALQMLVKRGFSKYKRATCAVMSARDRADATPASDTEKGLAENLCREDLHPVEAGVQLAQLLSKRNYSGTKLAASIGRSAGWISAHAAIGRNLHPELRDSLLRSRENIPWKVLYEASKFYDKAGEPDLERQKAYIFKLRELKAQEKPKPKPKIPVTLMRTRAKQLSRSKRFTAEIRAAIPDIVEALIGDAS